MFRLAMLGLACSLPMLVRAAEPAAAGREMFVLRLQILDIDVAKLRTLGVDFDREPHAKIGLDEYANDDFTEALVKYEIAKVLARPTLAISSGRPASFQVGAEVPVTMIGDDGRPTVQGKYVGTKLDLVATARDDQRVWLELRACVTNLDASRGKQIDGQHVPAFQVREVDTAVELKLGQTHAILCAEGHADGTTQQAATAAARSRELQTVVRIRVERAGEK